jgi:hypothetical protein
MVILPTIYEDSTLTMITKHLPRNFERAKVSLSKEMRKIDKAIMKKRLRTYLRSKTNDALSATPNPVQKLHKKMTKTYKKHSKPESYQSPQTNMLPNIQTKLKMLSYRYSAKDTECGTLQDDLDKAFQAFEARTILMQQPIHSPDLHAGLQTSNASPTGPSTKAIATLLNTSSNHDSEGRFSETTPVEASPATFASSQVIPIDVPGYCSRNDVSTIYSLQSPNDKLQLPQASNSNSSPIILPMINRTTAPPLEARHPVPWMPHILP